MSDSISTTNWTQFCIQSVLVVAGIIVAGVFAFLSWKASQSNNQIQTDTVLINTRKEVRELSIKIEENVQRDEKDNVNFLAKYYKQAIEDMLNAYELSCGLYFDGVLDKKRFKKLRKKEIISLFNTKDVNGKFIYPKLHEKNNPFTAIEKFYDEVRDKE